jgi:hypothetical protein
LTDYLNIARLLFVNALVAGLRNNATSISGALFRMGGKSLFGDKFIYSIDNLVNLIDNSMDAIDNSPHSIDNSADSIDNSTYVIHHSPIFKHCIIKPASERVRSGFALF